MVICVCLVRWNLVLLNCIFLLTGNHGDLCVFGEKKSCIVKVDKNGLTATDRKIELKDWIWDAQFLNVCIILY